MREELSTDFLERMERMMTETPPPVVPPKAPERPCNPITHAQHRREVLRQITIPLILGGIVLLALAILTVWASVDSASTAHTRWASISLVWLILPNLLAALIVLALVVGLIYLATILLQKLPPFARQVQDFFLMLKFQVAKLDDKLVEPLLKMHANKASTERLGRRLRSYQRMKNE